jgi:hypothetical protein
MLKRHLRCVKVAVLVKLFAGFPLDIYQSRERITLAVLLAEPFRLDRLNLVQAGNSANLVSNGGRRDIRRGRCSSPATDKTPEI